MYPGGSARSKNVIWQKGKREKSKMKSQRGKRKKGNQLWRHNEKSFAINRQRSLREKIELRMERSILIRREREREWERERKQGEQLKRNLGTHTYANRRMWGELKTQAADTDIATAPARDTDTARDTATARDTDADTAKHMCSKVRHARYLSSFALLCAFAF